MDFGPEDEYSVMGHWSGPENDRYESQKLERGQNCWNGPDRSVKVHFKCGTEHELTNAYEPNGVKTPLIFCFFWNILILTYTDKIQWLRRPYQIENILCIKIKHFISCKYIRICTVNKSFLFYFIVSEMNF
ncbi:hypothetical protein KUTeg_015817, partial [Tegillarca granosa]